MKLEIIDLHVSVEGKEILKGVNLTIKLGEVHALMGPNGSGKSTLANVLMGHPKYKIEKGKILLNNEDITKLPPNERAKKGLFLSFQYPKEISGVSLPNFLRTARNTIKEDKLSVIDFHRLLKEKMADLNIDSSFTKRGINEGFSGGEKKRAEILQMSVLEPIFNILDETDSGLDVDALKIVANGINKLKSDKNAFLIITHYYRILEYLVPDYVHILYDGKIIKSGGKELAKQIEEHGFDLIKQEALA